MIHFGVLFIYLGRSHSFHFDVWRIERVHENDSCLNSAVGEKKIEWQLENKKYHLLLDPPYTNDKNNFKSGQVNENKWK